MSWGLFPDLRLVSIGIFFLGIGTEGWPGNGSQAGFGGQIWDCMILEEGYIYLPYSEIHKGYHLANTFRFMDGDCLPHTSLISAISEIMRRTSFFRWCPASIGRRVPRVPFSAMSLPGRTFPNPFQQWPHLP